MPYPQEDRKIALICAKGGLDEAYPALILANAARASGIEATIFFTFYGLDVVTEKKVDHLHVNMTGNPSSPMPTMVAGLPGMERLAANMMKKKMDELELPGAREMLEMLSDAGCRLYACELAMKMFQLQRDDLIPQVEDVITATDFYEKTVGAQIVFI
ncbi:MAG: DsrE/DsrF/DrsH-like family protein [Polyangiaceae bacterium]|nr:DsrE/DsrF/DrsH-like family protein [Myxococcales bacterium]MCB9590677.1 DsrE/DsrF/DrsH-like family protein [Polyangiaceae bacterium]